MESQNPESKEGPTKGATPNDIETFWALSAYIIFFLPLLSKYKSNDFVKFHTRQGFAIFVAFLISLIIAGLSPWFITKFLIYILIFTLWCFGVLYTLLGKKETLPIIGKIANKIF